MQDELVIPMTLNYSVIFHPEIKNIHTNRFTQLFILG